MRLGDATPILRIFDEAAARAFYLDFLGFTVCFEHRFAPDLPLYMGIARDGCTLHLSGHQGDTTPGTRIRIAVDGIDALAEELGSRDHPGIRIGRPEDTPWGERAITVTDPFGNRLTFHQRSA